MSKKMFLKRSYAEVVREQPTANPFPPEPEHQVEEPVGEPGESVITPKMRIFGYVKTNTEVKKEVPKKKRKSKVRRLVKQLPDFEDDLDYIYISGENSSSAGSVSDNEDDMKVNIKPITGSVDDRSTHTHVFACFKTAFFLMFNMFACLFNP